MKRPSKTIAFILGTRPEAIKLAPVILACSGESMQFRPVVINTGQHGDMVKPVLRFFGIRADEDLRLMMPGQSLPELTARAVLHLDEVLGRLQPAVVVVQGDTTTAMCGALAALYRKIPVAHVEAGLRTDNWYAPFPEEINRRIVSQVAHWHFAPTPQAKKLLLRESVAALGGRIVVTGNTVIDALHQAVLRIRRRGTGDPHVRQARSWKRAHVSGKVLLVTGHRRENFGPPFAQFCLALRDLVARNPELLIVYPVHLNPNVQLSVQRVLSGISNILLVEPKSYPVFVELMLEAGAVLTDSGGVQEEAPALGLKVVVTRNETERPEAVATGGAKLVGTNRRRIVCEVERALKENTRQIGVTLYPSPYGDGKAATRCLNAIMGRRVSEFKGISVINNVGL